MRLLAFYLPQFHPIPENDAWWGPGFTEWSNVVAGRPLFAGHEQPLLPGELGFYDLRVPELRRAQADLARAHGIHGFVYYHYWFGGRQLLERPFDEVLASGEPDFPFALCWANENWTRAWDGHDREVLIRQEHSEEDDRRHLRWFARAFADRRYIRVGGRPLLLVYRLSLLPDPTRTAAIWRDEARALGIEEPYLCGVESLRGDRVDPRLTGFDAAVEFQPDWLNLPEAHETPEGNRIVDYDAFVARQLAKPRAPYTRFPCVTPRWDNAARRQRDAFTLRGAHPRLYGEWLERTIERFVPDDPEADFVFVNSWNEWGEGAPLEPCQRWGRGFLEATRRAVANVDARAARGAPAVQPSRTPALSVCIPTYDGERYLEKTLRSVLAQEMDGLEVIVVDDGSTDRTAEIARSFDDPRLSLHVNADRLGIAGNWNRSLAYASGRYACVFHQDDLMHPGNLAKKARFLDGHPGAGMVFSNVWQIGRDDEVLSTCWYAPPQPSDEGLHDGRDFFRRLLLGPNIVCCPSVVARREVYDVVGGFDATLPFTLDWEMWLRIAARFGVGYLTEALVSYRRHAGMETNRFAGVRELEHALLARRAALERARGVFPDEAALRARAAELMRDDALERARAALADERRDEASAYLDFAIAAAERLGVRKDGEGLGRWLVANGASLTAPSGTGGEEELFGAIDEPAPRQDVRGDLVVRGWARVAGEDLAVAVAIDGAVRSAASVKRTPRPDVSAALPALGDTSRSGFELRVARGGDDAGERQLTVIFHSRDGRLRLAAPVPFQWAPAS